MTLPTEPDPDREFVESLLQPISGDNPSGVSLTYEPEYDAIRNARRSEDTLNRGVWTREAKVADWSEVFDVATRCLQTRTKDLQIAAWLTEALGHLEKFAGLRAGFQVMAGLEERFWDTLYPELDDGDVESRLGPFGLMNDPYKGLPSLIKGLPIAVDLNGAPLGYHKYIESRETDNAVKQKPANAKQLEAEGKINGKDFDKVVAQTPKPFYKDLVLEVRQCLEAFKAFEAVTDARFGRMSPSLLNVGKALADCLAWVEPILAKKLLDDPDPIVMAEAPPAELSPDEGTAPAEPAANAPSLTIEGVSIPHRKVVVPSGPDLEAPDYGRLLIEFQDRAKQLAEAGLRLKANREKYAEHLAELKKLDEEYDAVSQLVSQSREGYQLIAKLAKLPGLSPP